MNDKEMINDINSVCLEPLKSIQNKTNIVANLIEFIESRLSSYFSQDDLNYMMTHFKKAMFTK